MEADTRGEGRGQSLQWDDSLLQEWVYWAGLAVLQDPRISSEVLGKVERAASE